MKKFLPASNQLFISISVAFLAYLCASNGTIPKTWLFAELGNSSVFYRWIYSLIFIAGGAGAGLFWIFYVSDSYDRWRKK